MEVAFHQDAEQELETIPVRERVAALHAVEKLESLGTQLRFPHSSAVKGTSFRELRLRAGRSPWRLLYCQIEDLMVILAVVPEAQQNPRGFRRGCVVAEQRLKELVQG
jgi:phage-related protein